MSSFMGKKVNMFLLLMLMLVLIGFGAVSVYSQYTYKSLKSQHDNATVSLGTCQETLTLTNSSLTKLRSELNSTTTDIRKYDTLYEQKAAELAEKSTQLTSTQADLQRVTLQKEVYKKQIDEAYAKMIALNRTVTTLSLQVDDLEEEVNDLKEKVTCLRNTGDPLEAAEC